MTILVPLLVIFLASFGAFTVFMGFHGLVVVVKRLHKLHIQIIRASWE